VPHVERCVFVGSWLPRARVVLKRRIAPALFLKARQHADEKREHAVQLVDARRLALAADWIEP
jgi:hypothetical protein